MVITTLRALLLALSLAGAGLAQVIDCVVAEVNSKVITLTDLRILQAFAIDKAEAGKEWPALLEQILDKAIDRRVVIDLVQENISVSQEEVRSLLENIREGCPAAEWQQKLVFFGLAEEELAPFLEEKILFEKIIALRFNQSVDVNLREIEAYYDGVYLPAQKAQGAEPRPMIQILDEIEALIKNEKMAEQIAAWIKNLRNQAGIQINGNCLGHVKSPAGEP